MWSRLGPLQYVVAGVTRDGGVAGQARWHAQRRRLDGDAQLLVVGVVGRQFERERHVAGVRHADGVTTAPGAPRHHRLQRDRVVAVGADLDRPTGDGDLGCRGSARCASASGGGAAGVADGRLDVDRVGPGLDGRRSEHGSRHVDDLVGVERDDRGVQAHVVVQRSRRNQ